MKISIDDELYPERLRLIPNPPKQLYVLGNEELLKEKCIAIVGSRNCTENGAKLAEKFAKELSYNRLCIVSGMAKGIDTSVHNGALKVKGKTIAVLGAGFNHIFPKDNENLFKEIIKSGGAVITEYEEDVDTCPQGFALRNRIVSGLSLGVLVIEAKWRSGTAITAEFARKQKKQVFCIPHGLEDEAGIGTNRLIKEGANLVTETKDIMDKLKLDYKGKKVKEIKSIDLDIPVEYAPIYKCITEKPINIDELCKKTKMEISKINYILTMLELEGYIKQLPGKNYVR